MPAVTWYTPRPHENVLLEYVQHIIYGEPLSGWVKYHLEIQTLEGNSVVRRYEWISSGQNLSLMEETLRHGIKPPNILSNVFTPGITHE